jgi:hypothetical protein
MSLSPAAVDVDIVINMYERTYRTVLSPGYFHGVQAQNAVTFRGMYAVINNVNDPADAHKRAEHLVQLGELSGYAFVSDRIADAKQTTGVTSRMLRQHPYFLDFGIVMAVTGQAPWILGWDAEVVLERAADWISPAIELMMARRDVFSASPRWPTRHHDTLDDETVELDGQWALNWGFSDQVFLVRRTDLAAPIYRRWAPAAYARHADHPWTFEARLEAHQRASRRLRATHTTVRYSHHDLPEVVGRMGGRSGLELWQHRALQSIVPWLRRVPPHNPTWRI